MELKQNVSALRGILVVAYEEGLRLGRVSEIYIQKKTKQIEGISFKRRLVGLKQESYVSLENISRLGKEVVIISSEALVKTLPAEVGEDSLKTLEGFKVTTVDGTHLGELSDLTVTKNDGKISDLILAEGKIIEIEAEEITIGADAIMVPVDYAARVEQIEEEKGRVLPLKVDTEKVKETVKETVEKTMEKVEKTVGKVLKKTEPEVETEEKKPDES
jgi:sporulation protein YlmC with PRC-barrel domain